MRALSPLTILAAFVLASCGAGSIDPAEVDPDQDQTDLAAKYDAGVCSTGTTCYGKCVDKKTDPNNCGKCRGHCATGESCVLGHCQAQAGCPTGQSLCGTQCVDLAGDAANCGSCGKKCSSGTCSAGACSSAPGPIGPHGGTVSLLKFGVTGDTRPPKCDDTAHYPTAIMDAIADQIRLHGAQFALDLGDHMYICSGSALSVAQAQMSLYMQSAQRFGGTWFMTQGNHECSTSSPCLDTSHNVNHLAFMAALAPVSTTPYYSFDIQTSKGLVTFVVVADNSWSATQSAWLEQTLSTADTKATYTIIAKHHPENDTSVSTNAAQMTLIRKHKFSLLLAGHTHLYKHATTDSGRDLVLGTGGAPLVSGGTFYGFGMVEQLATGKLQVTVYDQNSNAPVDVWSVGPNS